MGYFFLTIAIVAELFGTSMLKASQGFTKQLPVIGTILGFACAFYFLSLSLKTLPLNTVYAIWSGLGLVATVVISTLIWKEKINIGSVLGISFIIVGVIVLNLFGPNQSKF